jgi:hypothetical protein
MTAADSCVGLPANSDALARDRRALISDAPAVQTFCALRCGQPAVHGRSPARQAPASWRAEPAFGDALAAVTQGDDVAGKVDAVHHEFRSLQIKDVDSLPTRVTRCRLRQTGTR